MSVIDLKYQIPNGGTFNIQIVDGELRLQGPSYMTDLTPTDVRAITALWQTGQAMRVLTHGQPQLEPDSPAPEGGG